MPRDKMNSSCVFEGHEYRMIGHQNRVQADLAALGGRRDFDKASGKRDCIPKTVCTDFRVCAFLSLYRQNTTADLCTRFIESLMDSLRPIRRPDLVAQWRRELKSWDKASVSTDEPNTGT